MVTTLFLHNVKILYTSKSPAFSNPLTQNHRCIMSSIKVLKVKVRTRFRVQVRLVPLLSLSCPTDKVLVCCYTRLSDTSMCGFNVVERNEGKQSSDKHILIKCLLAYLCFFTNRKNLKHDSEPCMFKLMCVCVCECVSVCV